MVTKQRKSSNIEISIQELEKRGARVFGNPVCKEVNQYIDEVSSEAKRQRLIQMFFAQTMDIFYGNKNEDDF